MTRICLFVMLTFAALTFVGCCQKCSKEEGAAKPAASAPVKEATAVTTPVVEENGADEGEAKTLSDLQAAFNGESNASAKYVVYAEKSQELGYSLVAALFRAASKAENIHATAHGVVIQSLGAKPIADIEDYVGKEIEEMLQDAIAGETHEFTEMYPEFIEDAEKAGFTAAVISFEHAMDAEKEHAKLYKEALDNLDEWKNSDKEFVVCPHCGFTAFEVEANCPVCGVAKSRFLTFKPE